MEISVSRISQFFNSLDPSPFYEKDLDDDAEEYLVSWAQELPHDAPLSLTIHLRESLKDPNELDWVPQAISRHFKGRARFAEFEFRNLMRQGRMSLAIGLICMVLFLLVAQALAATSSGVFPSLLRESLMIAGWVAMWKPMQIYLYDWWPLLGRVRLYERMSAMPVSLQLPKPE